MNGIYLSIPCRGCRNRINETVREGYDLGDILRRYGWERVPDGIGFLCERCRRPGAVTKFP